MTKTPPGFTRTLLSIAVPVTLQNLLASSFTLVDTMMIGRLGDTPLEKPKKTMVKNHVHLPAMLNESAWALGNLLYSSVYGHMGTGAYASITVVKSIEDLTSVAVMGLCSSCAVMIGSAIGRGDVPLSKLCAKRHVQLTIGLSVLIGAGMLALRQPLLSLFGVSQAVRDDALAVLAICALEMVLHNIPAILVMGVFRAGGDTRFGLIVDCITLYLIGLPLTMLAGLYLHWSVPMTYLVMYLSEDIIKCSAYLLHFRSYKWIRPVI